MARVTPRALARSRARGAISLRLLAGRAAFDWVGFHGYGREGRMHWAPFLSDFFCWILVEESGRFFQKGGFSEGQMLSFGVR